MITANEVIYQHLPVSDLKLDRNNPRIAQWIEMYGDEVTTDQMSLALGAGAGEENTRSGTTFHSLREAIKTNGGIIHPIIVNSTDEGYIVIEGNTRTLIFQEFDRRGDPGNWETIPALVYQDLDQASIDAIRLQAHLVGPREWSAYSKAKYLDHLRNSQHLTWAQIVDFCGGQERDAKEYVAAYRDMEDYYRPLLDSDGEFDPTRFSAFVELQKSRVQQALLEKGFTQSDFAGWVKDGLIQPLNTVRMLPNILRDRRSTEVFLQSGAKDAQKFLDVPSADEVILDVPLEVLARELSRRVFKLDYGELQRLRSDLGTSEILAITDARDHLVNLCKDIASPNN